MDPEAERRFSTFSCFLSFQDLKHLQAENDDHFATKQNKPLVSDLMSSSIAIITVTVFIKGAIDSF